MFEKQKAYLTGASEKAKSFFGNLSRKVLVGISATVLVLVALAIVLVMNQQPYSVLVTGVSSEEASAILSFLEEQGLTDYRLENNDTILVPASQEPVIKARLLMEGYPKSGFSYSSYYENIGSLSTESERNAAFLIALQDRMSAVIEEFQGVKTAYVTISQGEDRTYVLDSNNVVGASASVMLAMHEGYILSDQQADAIRNLVANAVQGLEIGSVTISDTMGNMYTVGTEEHSAVDASTLKMQLEQKYNNLIRTNVMQILQPIYGEGNVKVGVNCTVDVSVFRQDSTDVYLPEWSTNGEGIIGSKVYDNYVIRGGDEVVGGVVGTQANSDLNTYVENLLDPDGTETAIGTSGQVDYDNTRQETHVERMAGYLTDCMVSVSINSRVDEDINEAALLPHVARAAGISDAMAAEKISILAARFYVESPPITSPSFWSELPMWVYYAAAGALLLLILIIILISVIVRRRRRKRQEQLQAEAEANRLVDELLDASAVIAEGQTAAGGADVMDMKSEKSMELRQDIRRFVDENPEIAAQMIRNWLRGGDE